MKKPTLKKLLIFQEFKFSKPKFKKPLFFLFLLCFIFYVFFRSTPQGFFITVSWDVFISPLFYYCFRVFSLLIAFVQFIFSSIVFISPLNLLLFLEGFHFNFLYRDRFLSGSSFFCCCTTSSMGPRELFLLYGIFYLPFLLIIWHHLLLSRLTWDRHFCLEGCRASHWGSKHIPGPSVCLNHTVFSKM